MPICTLCGSENVLSTCTCKEYTLVHKEVEYKIYGKTEKHAVVNFSKLYNEHYDYALLDAPSVVSINSVKYVISCRHELMYSAIPTRI